LEWLQVAKSSLYLYSSTAALSVYFNKPVDDTQKDECFHAYVSERKTGGSNKEREKNIDTIHPCPY
jgi:hypothetical protein